MMEIGSILLAGFFFLLAAGYLRGQQDDPSEIFLKPTCRPSKAKNWSTRTGLRQRWPNIDLPEA